MKAKKYIAMLLMMTTLVVTVSCSGEDTSKETSKTKDGKAEIKLDVLPYEGYLMRATTEFNETNKKVRITYDTVNFDEDYKNNYITSLAVGEGPDIIRIEPWLFSGINKVADSGVLYDINELINTDKNFKLSDYNQKALDGGVVQGKRFYIPLGYDFKAFYAKSGVFKDNGINTEGSKWTLGYLADEASKYTQKNKDSGKSFMISYDKFTFSDIVKMSGLNLVDYEKKKSNINSTEFTDLLNFYKKMYTSFKETQYSFNGISTTDSMIFDILTPEINNGTTLGMENVTMWYNNDSNKRMNVYLYPQYTNKQSILIEPMLSIGINSNSKYKNEIYEFLKLLLSEKYQTWGSNSLPYIPVNNNAYLNNANFYICNLGNAPTGYVEYDAEKRKEQVKAQMKEIESISRCDTVDAQIYDIMDVEAKSFVEGKCTAERATKSIHEKVMLFLNE